MVEKNPHSGYHGGESFNGQACHKVLQNIDQLELLAYSNTTYQVQPWIEAQALRNVRKVIHSCFDMQE